jgi:cytosine/uracil/thiamine/allantoin permease
VIGTGTALVVRSVLWITLALVFLVRDGMQIERARTAGAPVTNWMVIQLVLWLAVLAFWISAAWRGWKRRNDPLREVPREIQF